MVAAWVWVRAVRPAQARGKAEAGCVSLWQAVPVGGHQTEGSGRRAPTAPASTWRPEEIFA